MKPEYDEIVVTGIIYNEKFCWTVFHKNIWFLDVSNFNEDEYFSETALCIRMDYQILDKNNIGEFLDTYKNHIVSSEKLRNAFKNGDEETKDDFSPVIVIDFDNNKFISFYPEPNDYESYIPSGWEFSYEDFTSYVPENDRYWLN